SPKQSPNAAQRRLIERYSEWVTFKRFALISGSPVIRGAVTAIAWLFRGKSETKAFAPGAERDALAWLEPVSTFDFAAAFAALDDCVQQVGYAPLPRMR